MVGFADKAAQDANEKTKEFQENKYNNMGSFSMNAGSMSGLETETSYASKNVEDKKEAGKTETAPEAPKEEKENIAGVQVESADTEKHTDGVLVGDGDKVASEVSEDGRSLEYVEVE